MADAHSPLDFLRPYTLKLFDLRGDQADPEVIDQTIRAGVVFEGTNLWLLIFAILVASIGLNVNSTAVIIGAMLISPLMGPIMGAGYGVSVGDFKLLRLSIVNLARAASASLRASAIYFSLSPLSEAHSELLARTTPSIWDVGIALFGGLAGIVGVTRKEKSNVLPGVAIATALMPPLCTAGYGIATLQPGFFLGAFYLFFINSVFIAAATVAMTRIMHLPTASHVDAATRKRARRWIALVVTATLVPSVVLARQLVQAEVFHARAQRFLSDALPDDGQTLVATSRIDPEGRLIRVTLIGEPLSEETKEALSRSLPLYGLDDARLVVHQQTQATLDIQGLRDEMTADLYAGTLKLLESRSARVAELEASLEAARRDQADADRVVAELGALLPAGTKVTVTSGTTRDGARIAVALLEQQGAVEVAEEARLEAWLRERTGAAEARVLHVPPAEPTAPSEAGPP